MLREEMSTQQLFFFMKEIFASLREVNRRMEELKWVLDLPCCDTDLRVIIEKRFTKLEETKFCLIEAIYKTREQNTKLFKKEQYDEILGSSTLHEDLRNL